MIIDCISDTRGHYPELEGDDLLLSKPVTAELTRWQAVQRWDGKPPQVTGHNVPFINFKNSKGENDK